MEGNAYDETGSLGYCGGASGVAEEMDGLVLRTIILRGIWLSFMNFI